MMERPKQAKAKTHEPVGQKIEHLKSAAHILFIFLRIKLAYPRPFCIFSDKVILCKTGYLKDIPDKNGVVICG